MSTTTTTQWNTWMVNEDGHQSIKTQGINVPVDIIIDRDQYTSFVPSARVVEGSIVRSEIVPARKEQQ